MHSYIPAPDGNGWLVIFYLPETQRPPDDPIRHSINVVKKFALEGDAASYVAFLNGGALVTCTELIDRGIE